MDTCSSKRCRQPAAISYSAHPEGKSFAICRYHWERLCCATPIARVRKGETESPSLWSAARALLQNLGYSETAVQWWIAKHRVQGITASVPCNVKEFEMATKKTEKKGANKKAKKTEAGSKRGAVREAWMELLVANESAPRKKKLTDEQISKEMQRRFPDRDSQDITDPAKVRVIRRIYNNGYYNDGVAPKVQSRRYDEQGNVLEGRQKAQPQPKAKGKGKDKAKDKKARRVPIG